MKMQQLCIFMVFFMVSEISFSQNVKILKNVTEDMVLTDIEKELMKLSVDIDSLTKDKYERSASLNRGMGGDSELYDSLMFIFEEKFEEYLKNPISTINSALLLMDWINVFQYENVIMYQWEYISGGTQKEMTRYVQTILPDGIQVYQDDSGYRIDNVYPLESGSLIFRSKKGCSTCCLEEAIYVVNLTETIIYSLEYRNWNILGIFSFDENRQILNVNYEDVFIEQGDEQSERISDDISFQFNGFEFQLIDKK